MRRGLFVDMVLLASCNRGLCQILSGYNPYLSNGLPCYAEDQRLEVGNYLFFVNTSRDQFHGQVIETVDNRKSSQYGLGIALVSLILVIDFRLLVFEIKIIGYVLMEVGDLG